MNHDSDPDYALCLCVVLKDDLKMAYLHAIKRMGYERNSPEAARKLLAAGIVQYLMKECDDE